MFTSNDANKIYTIFSVIDQRLVRRGRNWRRLTTGCYALHSISSPETLFYFKISITILLGGLPFENNWA